MHNLDIISQASQPPSESMADAKVIELKLKLWLECLWDLEQELVAMRTYVSGALEFPLKVDHAIERDCHSIRVNYSRSVLIFYRGFSCFQVHFKSIKTTTDHVTWVTHLPVAGITCNRTMCQQTVTFRWLVIQEQKEPGLAISASVWCRVQRRQENERTLVISL